MICTTVREPQRLIIEQQNLHCPRYVPKIKDAGFHTVYFRILRNGYKTVTGKEKVILRTYGSSIKRDPIITLPVKLSLNYNGIDQSLLKAGATASKTFTKKTTKKTLKKLTAGKKTTKKTLMKLSSKRKTYRIRIRSFTKVKNPTTGKTEKIRGKWSAIKKAKA